MPFPPYRERFTGVTLERELDFTIEEYRDRLRVVQAEMARRGLELLILGRLADICWLSGFQTPSASTFAALLVPAAGAPVLHAIDHEYACARYTSWLDDIRTFPWFEPETGFRQHVQLIRELAATGSTRIGMDGRHPLDAERVRLALAHDGGRQAWTDATGLVTQLRRVKSPAEIAAMRESGRIGLVGCRAATAALKPGMTDNDVAAVMMAEMIREGAEFHAMGPFVATGVRSSIIHTTWKRRPIERGDHVFLEVGPPFKRYNAPVMRTAIMGEPSALAKRLTAAVEDTLDRLFGSIRAGATGHDVALEAAKGFKPIRDEIFFQGAFGYSVGLALPSDWAEGSTPFIAEGIHEPLVAGMTLHLPVAARVVGVGGVALSETVLVTETGCESLTATSRELAVVGR